MASIDLEFQVKTTKAIEKLNKDIAALVKVSNQFAKQNKVTSDSIKEINKTTKQANKSFNEFFSDLKTRAAVGFTALNQGLELASKAFNLIQNTIGGTVLSFAEFEAGLVGVGKTTNLSGQDLESFGQAIQQLATQVPIAQGELLNIAQAAGQLGVTGQENLLVFTDTIAKLGSASDLAGDEAATALTRILNVTGESISEIDTFASVIVALGNNFAATESEIARVTTEVSRATAQFGVSSSEAAAFSTALRSVGVQAELGGTVLGKAFRQIDESIREGGAGFLQLQRITGQTGDQLRKTFEEDSGAVFQAFIEGLGRVDKSGGSVSATLEEFGLVGEGVNKVLPVLAQRSDLVGRALELANKETENATALNEEAEKAFNTLSAQLTKTGNAIAVAGTRIGAIFAPAVNAVLESIARFANNIAELADEFNDLDLEDLAVTFGILAGSITTAIAAINTQAVVAASKSFLALSISVAKTSAASAALAAKFAVVAAGVGTIATGVELIARNFSQLGNVFSTVGNLVLSGLTDIGASLAKLIGADDLFEDLSDSAEGFAKRAAEASTSLDLKPIERAVTATNTVTKVLTKTVEGVGDAFDDTKDESKDAAKDIRKNIGRDSVRAALELSDQAEETGRTIAESIGGGSAEAAKESKENLKTLENDFKKLETAVADAGKTEIEILRETQNRRVKIVEDAVEQGITTRERANEIIEQINQDFRDKEEAANKESLTAQQQATEEFLKDQERARLEASKTLEELGTVEGFAAKTLTSGLEGVAKEASVAFATSLTGPLGGAVAGSLFEGLSGSEEEFRQFIDGLFSADFIANILTNLGTLTAEIITGELPFEIAKGIVKGVTQGLKGFTTNFLGSINPANFFDTIFGKDAKQDFDARAFEISQRTQEIADIQEQIAKEQERERISFLRDEVKANEDQQQELNRILEESRQEAQKIQEDAANETLRLEQELLAQQEGLAEARKNAQIKAIEERVDAERKLLDAASSEVSKLESKLESLRSKQQDRAQSEREKALEDATRDEGAIVSRAQSDLNRLISEQDDLRFDLLKASNEEERAEIENQIATTQSQIDAANALLLQSEQELNAALKEERDRLGIEEQASLEDQIATAEQQLLEAREQEKAALAAHNAELQSLNDLRRVDEVAAIESSIAETEQLLAESRANEENLRKQSLEGILSLETDTANKVNNLIQQQIDLKRELAELDKTRLEELNERLKQEQLELDKIIAQTRTLVEVGIPVVGEEALGGLTAEEVQAGFERADTQEPPPVDVENLNINADDPILGFGEGVGFQEGGIVPEGFPNDSFPAALTSGELVVPAELTDRLDAFLNQAQTGGEGDRNVQVTLVVGEEQLAEVMLNLNRQGFRTGTEG